MRAHSERLFRIFGGLILFVAATTSFAGARSESASYLDNRATAWLARGSCALSCHTTFPYLALRPLLEQTTKERAVEAVVRGRIEARVTGWETGEPWYASIAQKARANEAALNAAALTLNDAHAQRPAIGPVTRRALEIMWFAQRSDGSWDWMDGFGLKPWETSGSGFWGALQVAIALGRAPGGYLAECEKLPAVAVRLDRLRRYLMDAFRAGSVTHYHQAFLLQASTRMSGLLTAGQMRAVAAALVAVQADDGSWNLAQTGGWSRDGGASAYATAVMTTSLSFVAEPEAQAAAHRGKAWLRAHQNRDGSWTDISLNRPESAFNNLLMTDAATAYAAAALRD